jgi:hypothetical protein
VSAVSQSSHPTAAAHDRPPTFSVVIAAYQAAGTIGEAVKSALEQDPAPFEVIIGDDGSTDDLAGALAPFGPATRRVLIEHAGEAAAKNAAAAAATGEFLAFLDADDRFLPGRLAAMGALTAARPELDGITTDANLVYEGQVVGRCYGPGNPFASDDQRSAILRRNFVLGLCAIRRSRFNEVGGFDTAIQYTTDWDLWIRLIFAGVSVGFIPEPLAEYHLHTGSLSARRTAMARGRLETLANAAARADLTDEERSVVAASQARERLRLARESLREELISGRTGAVRRAALAIATSAEHPLKERLRALASVAAPGVLARRARADDERWFATVGERRFRR